MLEERTSEGAGYSAESAGGLLLEERLLRVGKALGFEGSRLAQYVERKMKEVNARREHRLSNVRRRVLNGGMRSERPKRSCEGSALRRRLRLLVD